MTQNTTMAAASIMLLLALTAGCASAPVSRRESLVDSSASSTEIKKDLSRHTNEMGYYAIDVFPESAVLSGAQLKEDEEMSDAVRDIYLAATKSAAATRICFNVTINTLGYLDSRLSLWKVYLDVPSESGNIELFVQDPVEVRTVTSASYGYRYSSKALMCAYSNPDLAEGFNIGFIPPASWERAPASVVSWAFER